MKSLFLQYRKSILSTTALLSVFAIIGALMVGLTYISTADDIRRNEELQLLKQLNTIVPAELYNNDLLSDTITIKPNTLLGTSEDTLAYRARKDGKPVAAVFSSIAPNGYNGAIHILVGVFYDGRIAGVRVVKHHETPGLGDAVDASRSDWILGFNNKSLDNPKEKLWKVKRDGGVFDQFTGATITPRAVVKAVYNALLYFNENREKLFASNGKAAGEKTADTPPISKSESSEAGNSKPGKATLEQQSHD
ncbi:MAG TPA: electron transport complex subunit RsxG [Gammaproteobacteria bacterium]|nr:electron transport complex subunit RsxG [Gammaproteobacteria bacterium]